MPDALLYTDPDGMWSESSVASLISFPICCSTIVAYYVALLVLSKVMATRGPFSIQSWVYYHNQCLAVGSGVLLTALVGELGRLRYVVGHTWMDIYCPYPEQQTEGFLFLIYYVNYIFKVRKEGGRKCRRRRQRRMLTLR
jgi:hypothetical protein